jgi:hypothetical protein
MSVLGATSLKKRYELVSGAMSGAAQGRLRRGRGELHGTVRRTQRYANWVASWHFLTREACLL